jgi:FlaA1/EpsC-like NDP-sugar epimerase
LILLDRDESLLHSVQLSMYGSGLLDTDDLVLCSIRDHEALLKVFQEHRPDVVFHAAALKHLPLLERYPAEGWKTNVLGTLNVLRCAQQVGVQHLVNISTDKAADPTSVLGQTKRLAERLTAWYAVQYSKKYLSVRFGNVLGSRGSVLYTFKAQIDRGGPVTVTHPDVTRFFMTIPEACELVLQAGAIGNPGDVLVLDMGEPVKIVDVAQRLIDESGRDLAITFTGLRQGEKLDEALLSSLEEGVLSDHPLITRVEVPPLSPGEVLLDDAQLAHIGDLLADSDREHHTVLGAAGGAGPREWGVVR